MATKEELAQLRIETFDLGEGDLEAFYLADITTMAIHSRLPYEAYRARALEAAGYVIRPPAKGRKACFSIKSLQDIDTESVRAMRRVVECLDPEAVEEVKDARRISGDPRWIAAYCHIDLQEVVAILANLNHKERP